MGEKESTSHEELVRYLEQKSGRSMRSREDVRVYLEELATRRPGETPAARRWLLAKQGTLLSLLVLAFVQYYVIDITVQILSLRENTYFLQAKDPGAKPRDKAIERT